MIFIVATNGHRHKPHCKNIQLYSVSYEDTFLTALSEEIEIEVRK